MATRCNLWERVRSRRAGADGAWLRAGSGKRAEFAVLGIVSIVVIALVLVMHAGTSANPQGGAAAPSTPIASVDASLTASPAPGQQIAVPGAAADSLTLMQAAQPATMSEADALQAVANFGIPWAHGGEYDGQTVAMQAYYGLATFGKPGPNGTWIGPVHQSLPNGAVLDHIANRPMWIINYGNIVTTIHNAGGTIVTNHAVYAVDVATRTVLRVWAYHD